MKKLIVFITLLFLAVAFCGCEKVTETGNPCPSGDCPANSPGPGDKPTPTGGGGGDTEMTPASDEKMGSLVWYHNSSFAISIGYPEGWTRNERKNTSSVAVIDFSNPEVPKTRATVTMEVLSRPATLAELVAAGQCVGRQGKFSGTYLTDGYMCDDSMPGSSGGDAINYYFLNGTVFIQVMAEAFDTGREGLSQIAANIKPD